MVVLVLVLVLMAVITIPVINLSQEKDKIKEEKDKIKEDNFFIQLKNESLKNLTPPVSLTYPTLTDAFKDFAIKMSANKETKEQFDHYVIHILILCKTSCLNGWTVSDYPSCYFPFCVMPDYHQSIPFKVEGSNLSMAFEHFTTYSPVSNEDAICYCTALELYSERVIKTNKTLDKYGNIVPYSKKEE